MICAICAHCMCDQAQTGWWAWVLPITGFGGSSFRARRLFEAPNACHTGPYVVEFPICVVMLSRAFFPLNKRTTGRQIDMNPTNILSGESKELLKAVIHAQFSVGEAVSFLKFRADNYPTVHALDELESKGLLKRIDGKYVVSALTLLLIADDVVNDLLSDIEKIYAIFQQSYKASPGERVAVDYVVEKTSLSVERIGIVLPLMLEISLWSQGNSLHFHGTTAYVTPSEGVLKYPKFLDALTQILEWQKNPSWLGSIYQPLLTRDAFDESQNESALSVASVSSSPQTLVTAWPAIRSCLQELTFYSIKDVAGLAGLNLPAVANLVQEKQGDRPASSKGQLMSAIDGQFGEMTSNDQNRFLTIAAEEILRRQSNNQEKLSENLSRLGWAFSGGTLTSTGTFNPEDLVELPVASHKDLLKAAQRFRDGDLSGSVSAACGAVDAATSAVYQSHSLGDPTNASFQERCKCAARAKGVSVGLEGKLTSLGWAQNDIIPFCKNFEGALNQGAFVMQTLRSHMGDVHGSKPILRPLVFDSLRWAELIVASLAE